MLESAVDCKVSNPVFVSVGSGSCDTEVRIAKQLKSAELELSRYAYLRNGAEHDSGLAQDIAMQGDFTIFLRDAPLFAMLPPRLHLYLTMANQIPENLVVLRFERLTKDIETYMSMYLDSNYQLPLLNKAEHASYHQEYNEERELLCFNKHRFFFEKGSYSREAF